LIDEGIYLRLLSYSWKHEGCQLPDDIAYLKRLCKGVREKRLRSVLAKFFVRIEVEKGEFYFRNLRLFTEFCKTCGVSIKRSEAAKLRWDKEKHCAIAVNLHMQTGMQNDAIPEAIYQKPYTRKPLPGKKPGDPRVKEIIDYFFTECEKKHGFKPSINGGQDGTLTKAALKIMTVEEIKGCIDYFIVSEKAEKCGLTLSIALSSHTLNTFRQGEGLNVKSRFERIFGVPAKSDRMAGSIHRKEAERSGHEIVDGEACEVSEMET
jgi:uncharacterized protein YdaU (DUF1376 family)